MIYLLPNTNPRVATYAACFGFLQDAMHDYRPNRGFLRTGRYNHRQFAIDNGGFTGRFREDRFFQALESHLPYQRNCLFVVVPDVVNDAKATRERYEIYASRVQGMGYRTAYVLQDGQEGVRPPENCDAYFIGGSTAFKYSTTLRQLVRDAKRARHWVHMGRVNWRERIHYCRALGVDSVDGTCFRFGPEVNYRRLLHWMTERLCIQSNLPMGSEL